MALATGTALAIGGGLLGAGLFGQAKAGERQARAAGQAAQAQEAVAREQLQFAKESQAKAIEAAKSPQELAQLERLIGQQESAVARQQSLLNAVDPALMEAGKQALSLLRGEETKSLGVVRQSRALQRQQLLDTLRKQLGPGAETSSAGIQALNNFDLQTQQLEAGTQQQALQTLLGSAQQSGATGRQTLLGLGQQGLGIAQGFGASSARLVDAINSGQAAVGQAGGALRQSAGSQFVQSQIAAQNQASLFGTIGNIGGQFIGAGLAGGGQGIGGGGGQSQGFQTTANAQPRFGTIA